MEVKWLNSNKKKTVVLTCIKIRLKALYSFKCLIMYSTLGLNKELDLEKSGKF